MSKSVILPYDPTWKALEWAKVYCKSYITNRGVEPRKSDYARNYARIEYCFGDERDATMFRLKWS